MPNLNELNHLVAVATHDGLPTAGRALDAPKSGLRRRIPGLEDGLGLCVLERSARQVQVIVDDRQIAIIEERVEVTLRLLPEWTGRQDVVHIVPRRRRLPGVRAVLELLAKAFNSKASAWKVSV